METWKTIDGHVILLSISINIIVTIIIIIIIILTSWIRNFEMILKKHYAVKCMEGFTCRSSNINMILQ